MEETGTVGRARQVKERLRDLNVDADVGVEGAQVFIRLSFPEVSSFLAATKPGRPEIEWLP